jgi:hypothetical protein
MPARFLILAALGLAFLTARGAEQPGLNSLPEIPFTSLSSQTVSSMGAAALAIRKDEWKHAETPNFIHHFFRSFIATPVSVEAEFYYRFIARDLGRNTAAWERKCHVFIFERPEDWQRFQTVAHLDPWSGGIHSRGELFIVRNPAFRFKGHSLAHETTHLVIDRFFGANVPLWVNEGYAEYAGQRAYCAFLRARGMNARPGSQPIAPADYIPLGQLADFVSYPENLKQVDTFYDESHRLVRFLSGNNGQQFVIFLDALAKGSRTESALWKAFGGRFPGLDAVEREFKSYASKDYGSLLQN